MTPVATRVETDGAVAQAPRFALNAHQSIPVINREVVAAIFPKRHQDLMARAVQRKHDGEGAPVADYFGVDHPPACAHDRTV
jgi:hypothetical protein